MKDKDSYYFYIDKYKKWVHRPPLKVLINPILRFVQFWTKKPYVIASITEFIDDKPHFLGYDLCRIENLKNFKN